MKFSQILNELQGISFNARAWNSIILRSIKISKNSPNPIIIGQDYPGAYQQFPIDFIHFKIDENYDAGAGYDEQKSGYDNDGKYHVYFVFGPFVGDSSINHELKHAFEDYMRISKGHKSLSQTKEAINFFGDGFEQMMMSPRTMERMSPITTLLKGLYYTSKIERSAFSDTVYDSIQIIDYIKSLMDYCNADFLLKKYSSKDLESKWNKVKEDFHIKILDKFDNYNDFIIWASDEIKYMGNKTLKKLRKVQYLSQQNKKEGGK